MNRHGDDFFDPNARFQSEEGFDTAQICRNGHVLNSSFYQFPQFNSAFCDKCGVEAITQCPSCAADIRGRYIGSLNVNDIAAPAYCNACGKSFPWTDAALQTAREYADELHQLPEADRQKLKDTFVDLTADSPKTVLAATRFQKLMNVVGKPAATAMVQILTTVLTAEAKKQLGLP